MERDGVVEAFEHPAAGRLERIARREKSH